MDTALFWQLTLCLVFSSQWVLHTLINLSSINILFEAFSNNGGCRCMLFMTPSDLYFETYSISTGAIRPSWFGNRGERVCLYYFFSQILTICRLTFVIVNRLVLNLNHELHSQGRENFETSLLESRVASFSVLGNIGGPLKTEGYYIPNEELRTLEFELRECRRTNRMSLIELENGRLEVGNFDRTTYKPLG